MPSDGPPWTWKERFPLNPLLYIGGALFIFLIITLPLFFSYETPEHVGYLEATLVSDTVSSSQNRAPRHIIYAELKTGRVIKISNYPNSTFVKGKRVKLEHLKEPKFGYNTYRFVEYIEERD